jgi:excisionase family DNA binding protein
MSKWQHKRQRPTRPAPPIDLNNRLTLTVREACQIIPCGRTHLYRMLSAGLIRAEKLGSKTLIIVASLPGAPARDVA